MSNSPFNPQVVATGYKACLNPPAEKWQSAKWRLKTLCPVL